MTTETRRTRDPLSLAKTVTAALYGFAVGEGAMVLSSIVDIGWLSSLPPGTLSEGLEPPHLLFTAAAWLVFAVTYLVSAFLVLKWIYRVNLNARAFSPAKTVSPPWAIGWYFVPFASLWMPLKTMSETWRISDNPSGWTTAPMPRLLVTWWVLYLGSGVLGSAAGRIDGRAGTTAGLITACWLTLVSSVIGIALCFVLIKVVREISQMQAIRLEPGLAQVFS